MMNQIYLTTNLLNGRKYIGMSNGKNKDYVGSGILIKKAIKKYGRSNFSKTILLECDSEEMMKEAEQFFIEEADAVSSPDYYNLHGGGRGGSTGFHKDTDMSAIVKKGWDNSSDEEKKMRSNKTSEGRKRLGSGVGSKNAMYGRSAVAEKNLKWYCNGEKTIYVTEGTEPDGYWRGRK